MSAAPSAQTNFSVGQSLEHPFGDHVHQVVEEVQRGEPDELFVGAGQSRRGGWQLDAGPDLEVDGDRQAGIGGRLPQRPVLRLAVELARLQRDAQLDDARMVFVLVDFAQCAGDVVGVDPYRAAEPVAEFGVIQPAGHHHLVVRGGDRGAQMAVRHDAPRHRVQHRHVDPAVGRTGAWRPPRGPNPGIDRRALRSGRHTRRPARRTSPSRSRGTRDCGTARAGSSCAGPCWTGRRCARWRRSREPALAQLSPPVPFVNSFTQLRPYRLARPRARPSWLSV